MIKMNDKLGSRDLRHLNLLVCASSQQQALLLFEGKTIPGVCTVERETYRKDGKWSHHLWECTLAGGCAHVVWGQGWDSALYVEGRTWERALADLASLIQRSAGVALPSEVCQQFIRAHLPAAAHRLDVAEVEAKRATVDVLPELVAAQAELAAAQAEDSMVRADIKARVAELEKAEREAEEAARLRVQAEEVRARAQKAKAALATGKSMNLADLRRLLV